MRRTRPIQVVPAVLAGLLVAGCGPAGNTDPQASASASSAPSEQVLSEAFRATSGASTARVQVRTEASAGSADSGSSFMSSIAAEGVLDFGSGDRQLVTQLPTGGETESRVVDGAIYTRLPDGVTRDGEDKDKPWLKLPLPSGAGQGLSGLTDPTGGLELLRDAGGPVTEVGRERVRDADTVHYRTELDPAKLPVPSAPPEKSKAGQPKAGQPDAGGLLRRLLGDAPLPVEVWVDDQQRIRRLMLVLPIPDITRLAQPSAGAGTPSPSASPAAGGGTSTSTTEFYDFGVAVDVQPPPADEVRKVPTRPSPIPSPTS